MVDVRAVNLDSFNFNRVDPIKMDVEGMEIDALAGAAASIGRHHPILLVEMVKTDSAKLPARLKALGYSVIVTGMNFLAIHKDNECPAHVTMAETNPAPKTYPPPYADAAAHADRGQKFLPSLGVIAEHAEHAARHHGDAGFVHAARGHALVRAFGDHGDAVRFSTASRQAAISAVVFSWICSRRA